MKIMQGNLGIKYFIKSRLHDDNLVVKAKRASRWVKIADISLGRLYTDEDINRILTLVVNSYGFESYICE